MATKSTFKIINIGFRMDKISLGFVLACGYNSGIGIFSKGFSDSLGTIDPLFLGDGCVGIQLWGLAYLALTRHYFTAPAVALVFCIEKLFYAQHWLFWLAENADQLPAMIENDPLTGIFFAIYGAGDIAFMFFFGWVAWKFRENLFRRSVI